MKFAFPMKTPPGTQVLTRVLAFITCIALLACNDNTELVDIVEDGEVGVVALRTNTDDVRLATGQSFQVSLSADHDDGTQTSFNDNIRWISADSNIARVSSDGTITAVSAGETRVSYHWRRISGTTTIVVSAAQLSAINFATTQAEAHECSEVSVTATGVYSDGTIKSLLSDSVWRSDNEDVVFVQSQAADSARLLLRNAGSANLTLTSGSVTATLPVTATDSLAELRLESSQENDTLETNTDYPLQIVAVYTDGTTQSINTIAGQILSAADIDTISPVNDGIVLDTPPDIDTGTDTDTNNTDTTDATEPDVPETILATSSALDVVQQEDATVLIRVNQPGQSTVTAVCGGLTTELNLTAVDPPTITSITFTNTEVDIEPGQTLFPAITTLYSDGSSSEETDNVQWTLIPADSSSFSLNTSTGAVTAKPNSTAPESAVLQATIDSTSAQLQIHSNGGLAEQLTSTQLYHIDQAGQTLPLTAAQTSIGIGDTLQLTLKSLFSSGREEISRNNLFWSNQNPAVASINGFGLLTAHAVGTTSITAIRDGVTSTIQFTVEDRTTLPSMQIATQFKILPLPVPGIPPAGLPWADSYSHQNKCYVFSTFDHNADELTIGGMNVVTIQNTQNGPGIDQADAIYNDVNCGNGPPNTAGDEVWCPGRVDMGTAGCVIAGPNIEDQLP